MEIRELKTGMVLQEDAYTPSGSQLILPKGTVLDDQRIARLAFYGVKSVNAMTREEAASLILDAPATKKATAAVKAAAAPPTDVPPKQVQVPPPATAKTAMEALGGKQVTPFEPPKVTPTAPAAPARPARPAPAPAAPPREPSYSERLRNSPEFKKFKMDFEDTFISYQRSINEIVRGDKEIDTHQLIAPVYDLIHTCYGPSNVFDMLHALRSYDDATYVHSVNVALIAHTIGEWMHLPEEDLELLTEAGLLHDIGKIMVPHEIVNKKEPLTGDERVKMRMHPQLGYRVLERKNVDQHIKNTVLMHHERCDGSGYPRHLTMEKIDPVARVIAIADVYDAMTSERVYRKALSPFYAFEMIERDGLQKYDPHPLMAFLENLSGAYIGNRVRLDDGSEGEIIYINRQRYSRPTVRTGPNTFVDLIEHPEIKITELI
ncbi:MAG: HD-GYP domain-containing protein [Lachnospiraceae bacterium]|nr:HD-GYP domain-containing protein [Lachnospiraceae bacterium]